MGCVGSTRAPSPLDKEFNEDIMRLSFHSQYQLGGELGSGSFGQVHLAIKRFGPEADEVAVKVTDLRAREGPFLPSRKKQIMDNARAAQDEATILRRVGPHPNIVRCLGSFQEECFSYLIMEKCDKTLPQVLERLPDIKEHGLRAFFHGMMKGIVHCASFSIVHRDIKPDNFLCCGPQNTVKLCDFGLASIDRNNECSLRGVCGTPPFMSPEMLGMQGYGASTDIWSFGVVAYLLLLGHFPYLPAERTTQAMKLAIWSGQRVPSFQCMPPSGGAGEGRVSDGAVRFLRVLLCRDPTARPTAKQVMRHSWMCSKAEADEPSLRPTLCAGGWAGAGDVGGPPESSERGKSDADATLATPEAKHHKADGPSTVAVPLPRTTCGAGRKPDGMIINFADVESASGETTLTESTAERSSITLSSSSSSNMSGAA